MVSLIITKKKSIRNFVLILKLFEINFCFYNRTPTYITIHIPLTLPLSQINNTQKVFTIAHKKKTFERFLLFEQFPHHQIRDNHTHIPPIVVSFPLPINSR